MRGRGTHTLNQQASTATLTPQALTARLKECLLADVPGLRKRLRSAQQRLSKGQPADRLLSQVAHQIEASSAAVAARTSDPLQIQYPAQLPVSERRDEIAAALAAHQVVVVAGETGSGKTTQLPKICLELGLGTRGLIGHTQPRRLAARTVAARIADELGCETGSTVGYQVRFTDQASASTRVKLMTDGILLAEIQHDRLLQRYDALIIDEAHERSLNIDFLLGYLKQILPRRPDLKVIITSATIDVERFAEHFDDAPVIEVSGRTYPVETHYCEPPEGMERSDHIAELVEQIQAAEYGPRGDMLVFLPGERDIREQARRLRGMSGLDVLPLYARLSRAEQDRVFNPGKGRGLRVVLATNVAETSLTVPGIRYVIDAGEARISRYSFRSRVQRLPIEPISQASARQRQGRCGRVAEGVCLRLYSEQDFLSRPEFTDPEILRTNLAAVILQMLRMGLGDVDAFPFIDPPDPRLVRDGYRSLQELGAVDAAGKLTEVGRQMSRLPIDPRLSRMLLAAQEQSVLPEVLVIASALSVQDPRERPADRQAQSDQAHARFRHGGSDFMELLNLWHYYEAQRQVLSQKALRKLCQREFFSFTRMREWRDVHHQLLLACRELKLGPVGMPVDSTQGEGEENTDINYEAIHRALLSGLLGNIAQHQERHEYLGARNRKLQIFPGSGQFKARPRWLMAAEVVETSKVYARCVARIDPLWVLDINPGLLKRHYHEPRWQQRSGRVMAYEQVSLYGLTVADKRRVHFGPIDPATSRKLMIREGLIPGRLRQPPAFLTANLSVVAEVVALEERVRRRDLLADEQVQYDFYDERLPPDCCTAGRLSSYLKKHPGADAALRFDRTLIQQRQPGADVVQDFPARLEWEGQDYALSYQFEPGKAADGISVTVPVALLNRIPRHRFDWLVPGLLRDKCIALVKGLPKSIRKSLVPAPDFVDRALAELQPDDTALEVALARVLGRLGGLQLSPDAFDASQLDDFYRVNFRIVDARGKLLAQGRELPALVQRFRNDTREEVRSAGNDSPARAKVERWDFDALPAHWHFKQAGVQITSYPALVDHGDRVAVELCDYPGQARLNHRVGLVRLLRQHNTQPVKYLRKQLLRGNRFQLLLVGAGLEREAMVEDLIDAAVVQCAGLNGDLPREQAAFDAASALVARDLVRTGTELEAVIANTLEPLANARRLLQDFTGSTWQASRADADRQVGRLTAPHSLRDTPLDWLQQWPRYARALQMRLERLRGQAARDMDQSEQLAQLAEPLWAAIEQRPGLCLLCEAAMRYRWMLEEFRVSLFAQSLGTRVGVSAKRLQAQWGEVEGWLIQHPH